MNGMPKRILVVEDEGMVAFALEQVLIGFGYEVVGPAPNTRKALKLLAAEAIDAALLDVNLGDERVDPVADALAAANIPFVFTTGYANRSALPPGHQDCLTLMKPYPAERLSLALAQLLAETDLPNGAVMRQCRPSEP